MKAPAKVPLDLSVVSPDGLAGKSLAEIQKLEVWRGNRRVHLGDVFQVEGEAGGKPDELSIVIEGDLSKARRVGKGMSAGKVVVNGPAGWYLGEEMKGGCIIVRGDAGSWVGSEMKNGVIEVEGDAGDAVGAGYRGGRAGMQGGLIVVKGNAGSEVGCWMKDGVIKIGGDVGLLAGMRMQGGTILIAGNSEGRLGASMVGGKVVLLGTVPSILPSFFIEEVRPSVKVGGEKIAGPFYTFTGDVVEKGSGRLFISTQKNPHLKVKEAYML